VLNPQPDNPPPKLPDGVRVKALSLNIYSSKKSSPEAIGVFLKAQSADVVGLQECPSEQLPAIAAAAGYQHYWGSGQCVLSKTPMVNPHMASEQPGRELVQYGTVIGGVTFSVYNAHTSWNVDGNIECRWIVDEVLSKDPNPNKLMTGDFNDEELSPQIEILDEALADASTKYGWFPSERISWPSTGFDDTEGSQLIDLIFVPKGAAAIVVDNAVVNLSPVLSDHKPVWADVLYQKDMANPQPDPYAKQRDLWSAIPPEGSRPPNLLANPGAEDGVAGWQISYGGVSVAKREHQTPHTGNAFFTGFELREEGWPHASIGSQTVDLAANAAAIDARRGVLYTYGWVTTGYQIEEKEGQWSNIPKPYDEGEVVVEALDANDAVMAAYRSKRRDTLQWYPFAGSLSVPPGARKARLTWISHHKENNGASNDAMFDDLYMGFGELSAAHTRTGGNAVRNGGAEDGTTGFKTPGWITLPDGPSYGMSGFSIASSSGLALFYAGGVLGIEPGRAGVSELAQQISTERWRAEILKGTFAVRWGGRARTWDGSNTVSMALVIMDGDGKEWGTVDSGTIFDAEWTGLEYLTRIPAGASAVKLVVRSNVSQVWAAAFADDLYMYPELVAK
jgi:endonuclease/exonuclease/phosphatase family metal-dependent hydrolase